MTILIANVKISGCTKGWNGLYNASKRNDPMISHLRAASYLLPTKLFRIAEKKNIHRIVNEI